MWVVSCGICPSISDLFPLAECTPGFIYVVANGRISCFKAKITLHCMYMPHCFGLFFFVCFFFCHPVACGVSRPGIRSEVQLGPKAQLWQCQILNPLCWAGDWTCVPVLQRSHQSHCVTLGAPVPHIAFIKSFWYILDMCLSDICIVFFPILWLVFFTLCVCVWERERENFFLCVV